uniref:non-specific serine/threonine protein kinase n=1 Tax=Caenorhabditis tropicalis TaxID=1561998 RepID=A0A1I7UMC5_9PELO
MTPSSSRHKKLSNMKIPYVHREKESLAFLSRQENSHPSVVGLYCTFQDAESLYFVLSYAKYGDLIDLMKKLPKERLTVEDGRYYAANLLAALDHIHSLGIIHRDVKPENLLVKEDGRILLTDFGSAKFLKDYEKEEVEEEGSNGRRRGSFVGSAQYCTPELLEGLRLHPSCDIWSFGVTLFVFLSSVAPFDDLSEYLVFRRVQDVLYQFPDDFPNEQAKDLIEKVIVKKEENRLKSDEIKRHPFFESIDFEKLEEIEPPKLF